MKAMKALIIVGTLLVARAGSAPGGACEAFKSPPSSGDPYAVIGVAKSADKGAIIAAYRKLARVWHPDKNRGACGDPEAAFAAIAAAYDVLLDPEKREVFDRLGQDGLERLRDGDPTVKKDYVPPDEVLRRHYLNGMTDTAYQAVVKALFAKLSVLGSTAMTRLRWLPILLGLLTPAPTVVITASEDATGRPLSSGGTASGAVTFKLSLSGKSSDFTVDDVVHNCGEGARFLGMKATYYLQCACPIISPGAGREELSVSVGPGAFRVLGGGEEASAASGPLALECT